MFFIIFIGLFVEICLNRKKFSINGIKMNYFVVFV